MRGASQACVSCLALALGPALTGACAPDSVAPGYYAADAGADDASELDDGASSTEDDSTSDGAYEGGTPDSPQCNMNGRWLVAQRVLAEALGQTQASHNWFYYEVTQNADQLTVTKGLHCGYDVVAVSALGANVSSQACWPDFLKYDSDTGRTGTMEVTPSGCELSFEKRYTVRGATASYYQDPSTTLPTVSEKASPSLPGWISWCNASNPGITLAITGTASGDLYCVQRDWNEYSGAVAPDTTTFQIPVTWNSDQDALGYTGSSLITMQDEPDSDPSQHYVWFAKLDSTQATGTDTEICAAVRGLVSVLTPDALQ
jgi:hypothetical protein